MNESLQSFDAPQFVLRHVQLLQQRAAVRQRHHLSDGVERQIEHLQVVQVGDVLDDLDVVVV